MTIKKQSHQRLLLSKLTPPVGGRSLIPRTRLIDWLQSAEHAKLVMLRAPAGFGKTTLMVQWLIHLRDQGVPAAWLTLDESDNDLVRFLTYLIAAIKKGMPEFGDNSPEPEATGAGNSPTGALLFLIDLLSTFEGPFTIFLDEFGALKTPEALEMIRLLLQHLPPGKRMVIALRDVPELNLGKLRAQGGLAEIDLEGLRFSLEETTEFIRQAKGLELDEKDVEFLYRSTEGWIAGLQLSTLSSIWREKQVDSQQFSAVFDNISDYLAEDVLAHQPEDVQSFLVRTSILARLSAPLCDALTGRTDSDKMLQYLEKQNLFLAPLDEERRWYRYHSLFAKFLQRQLTQNGGGSALALHRAACDWHAGAGEHLEAANHAMLASDAEYAAEQVEICALDLAKIGLTATVAEWAERLPAQVLDRHCELQLCYTYALIFSERYQKAHDVLDRLTHNVRRLGLDSYAQELRIARAFILMSQENFQEFEQVITEGLQRYDPLKPDTHTKFLPVLMNMAGVLKLTTGGLEAAQNIIWEGARLIGGQKDEVTVYNKYYEGRIYLAQGKIHEALLLTRATLDWKAYGPCLYSAGGTAIAVLEAESLYERNELESAEKLLTAYRDMLPTEIAVEALIAGFRTLARIRHAHGDLSGALSHLTELERLGVQRGIQRASASARQERIRIALQRGEPERAQRIRKDHDDDHIWSRFAGYCMMGNDPETPEVTRVRLLIGREKPKEALELLKKELKKAESSGYFRQVLLLRILSAKACESCGERRRAVEFLKDALTLAQGEGFVRCFVDEGESISKLIREIHKVAIAEEKNGGGSLCVEYLERIQCAMGAALAVAPRPSGVSQEPAAPLLEPLTAREQDILEKLALGLSSKELADSLYISVNTISYHLRNVYSKLGTNNRVHAVALARRFGLIK